MSDIFDRFYPNLDFLKTSFIKVRRIKFQGNPSNASREAKKHAEQKDGWTDITKETGAFHDYVNKPKIVFLFHNNRDDFRYKDKKVQSVINNCRSF